MAKSIFIQRAMNKAREHLQCDGSGWSLLGYSFKWLFSRARRKIVARLTGRAPEACPPPADKILVAVKLTGGLGDYVIFARVLRDLATLCPTVRFHVFCSSPGSAEWVLAGLPCVTGVFDQSFHAATLKHHDCSMHLHQLVYFDDEPQDLGKITHLAPALSQCLAHCRRQRAAWDVFIELHPTLNGAFAHHAVALGFNRHSFLHSQLGLTSGGPLLDLPRDDGLAMELAQRFGTWITINNGFDANLVLSTRQATKCYPDAHWARVVAGFKERRPDVKVVQIGGKTSIPIAGTDENLIGSTTLPQAAGVLRGGLLHVDIEGGLVHVAAALGVRSVVLFGPTSAGYFAYPDNINLSSGFCGNCWAVTERWMESCPRDYGSARCMDLLAPDRVLDAIVQAVQTPRKVQLPAA